MPTGVMEPCASSPHRATAGRPTASTPPPLRSLIAVGAISLVCVLAFVSVGLADRRGQLR
jgi:hypothetical protein